METIPPTAISRLKSYLDTLRPLTVIELCILNSLMMALISLMAVIDLGENIGW